MSKEKLIDLVMEQAVPVEYKEEIETIYNSIANKFWAATLIFNLGMVMGKREERARRRASAANH